MPRQSESLINRNYSMRSVPAKPVPPTTKHSGRKKWFGLLILLLVVAGVLGGRQLHQNNSATTVKVKQPAAVANAAKQPSTSTTPAVSAPATTACSANSSGQLAIVSISKRHLWACNGTTVVYDSAVITGMQNLAADLTPTGTFHISSKQTDLHLKGSDSTGSWDDAVNYWMPYLYNQYGSYGFHDATWRQPNDFGNISPYSSDASHGCVELPLATAKWVYNWAQVGTTVTIES